MIEGALGTYQLGKPTPIYEGHKSNPPKFFKDGEDAVLRRATIDSTKKVVIRNYTVSADAAIEDVSPPTLPPPTTEEPVEVSAMYLSVVNFMNLSDATHVDHKGSTWETMKGELMAASFASTRYYENLAPQYQTRI